MKKLLIVCIGLFLVAISTMAQKEVTLTLDSQTTHQRITGFGGFVFSPSFAYNHIQERRRHHWQTETRELARLCTVSGRLCAVSARERRGT